MLFVFQAILKCLKIKSKKNDIMLYDKEIKFRMLNNIQC